MVRHLSDEEWSEHLDSHPALACIPKVLRDCASQIHANKGETLFFIGERPQFMLFVTAGELRLIRRAQTGAEVVLQRSGGGFIAEASLEALRYHCDIVATESTQLLRLPIGRFRDCLRDDEWFRNAWMNNLAREVRKLRGQCERLSLHGAAERIEHYIEAEGQDGRLVLRQSKKAWAAELALTHEALYRTLAKLKRDGRISTGKEGEFAVLSMARAGAA